MKNALQVKEVTKSYGNFKALSKVSVAVPEGSVFGLLGPNGAGKTTLIRIINQIIMPDTGTVYLDGEKLKPHHIQQIGYLPEERGLYKSMKVGEQALYLAQLKGMTKAEAKNRLKQWFDKFEIGNWWNKKIQELSKGMAQKVQFIVTVLHQPKLLIFDEPFSGFDPVNANLIKDEILKLREQGASIIFSTHRMESVEEMCDYIALIDKSKKIIDGKLNEIKEQFKTNEFKVSLQGGNNASLLQKLQTHYSVRQIKEQEQSLSFTVNLKQEKSPNQLINYLNSNAQLTHFTEIIPNANDIFLKAVAQNE